MSVLLILAAAVIVFIWQLTRTGNNNRLSPFFSFNWRVYFGFLGLLLLAAGTAGVLPVKKMAELQVADQQKMDQERDELLNAVNSGDFGTISDSTIKKTWIIPYAPRKITLTTEKGEFVDTQIVVEQKNRKDGKIEATFYQSHSSMNGKDISIFKQPIQLEINNDKGMLVIGNPKKRIIEYSQLANVFTINQFTGVKSFRYSSKFVDGINVLYLRIPQGIEIADPAKLVTNFM